MACAGQWRDSNQGYLGRLQAGVHNSGTGEPIYIHSPVSSSDTASVLSSCLDCSLFVCLLLPQPDVVHVCVCVCVCVLCDRGREAESERQASAAAYALHAFCCMQAGEAAQLLVEGSFKSGMLMFLHQSGRIYEWLPQKPNLQLIQDVPGDTPLLPAG